MIRRHLLAVSFCCLAIPAWAQMNINPSLAISALVGPKTGTGNLVFGTSPTLVTPVLGAATGTSLATTGSLTAGTGSAHAAIMSGGATRPLIGADSGSASLIITGNNNGTDVVTRITSTGGQIEYACTDFTGGASFQPCLFNGSTYLMQASGATKYDYGTATAATHTFVDAVTMTSATVKLTGITTGTNADFLCLSAGSVVLLQTSACTISSMRFKNWLADIRPEDSLGEILRLKPIAFTMKGENRDPNYASRQVGLSAENVAEFMPACAVYEDDMKTPKSYRQECIIAELVGAIAAQDQKIAGLENAQRR